MVGFWIPVVAEDIAVPGPGDHGGISGGIDDALGVDRRAAGMDSTTTPL